MNNTLLIISREYLTRVKKKSFIIMTILGPLLMTALIIVPVYLASKSQRSMKVLVVDENEFFINRFQDTPKTAFTYQSGNIEHLKQYALGDGEYDAVLYILESTQSLKSILYFREDPPTAFRSQLEGQMDRILFDKVMKDTFNIDPKKFDIIKSTTRSTVEMRQIDEKGDEKKSFTELNRIAGMIFGFLIYFFIFMFASQVLRGVLEEKSNRIVEVLLSSVKPMELMMGKIVGVAMVGLTQFVLWILLTLFIVLGVNVMNPAFFNENTTEQVQTVSAPALLNTMEDTASLQQPESLIQIIDGFYNLSFSTLIFSFFFYFLFGYLLYAALYAGIGSAVDNETDSSQFTFPITVPLLLTIVLLVPISENPAGNLAWWFSMIPFTSPVGMLIRLPSGVPLWELILSMGILLLTFLLAVWFAAKIYRTGILMYGKKITYRELWKWLRY
jgi:ABC-2 type transport system permease protein